MKSLSRLTVFGAALVCLASIGAGAFAAQGAPVTAAFPVLLTSCGQSPGPERVLFFLKRQKANHDFLAQAKAQDLVDRQKAGNPYKTVIIVTGASLKGMGAAGVSMTDELSRTAALIAEAKRQGLTIIGAHVEGMARRAQGAAPGDNSDEMSIDAVMPHADFMIVRQDGNEDQRFTVISANKGIPLVLFEKNMELGDVLTRVFGK
jgi:hypothetical protein